MLSNLRLTCEEPEHNRRRFTHCSKFRLSKSKKIFIVKRSFEIFMQTAILSVFSILKISYFYCN